MDHNDLKCFSEAYQIKALKKTIVELEDSIMKVTKYCGEIETLTKLIKWAKPMANLDNPEHVQGLLEAENGLLDLIAKRDALLDK